MFSREPAKPVHVAGTQRGEEMVRKHGREPGREEEKKMEDVKGYRGPRDSTSINPSSKGPIDPRMPTIPPQ